MSDLDLVSNNIPTGNTILCNFMPKMCQQTPVTPPACDCSQAEERAPIQELVFPDDSNRFSLISQISPFDLPARSGSPSLLQSAHAGAPFLGLAPSDPVAPLCAANSVASAAILGSASSNQIVAPPGSASFLYYSQNGMPIFQCNCPNGHNSTAFSIYYDTYGRLVHLFANNIHNYYTSCFQCYCNIARDYCQKGYPVWGTNPFYTQGCASGPLFVEQQRPLTPWFSEPAAVAAEPAAVAAEPSAVAAKPAGEPEYMTGLRVLAAAAGCTVKDIIKTQREMRKAAAAAARAAEAKTSSEAKAKAAADAETKRRADQSARDKAANVARIAAARAEAAEKARRAAQSARDKAAAEAAKKATPVKKSDDAQTRATQSARDKAAAAARAEMEAAAARDEAARIAEEDERDNAILAEAARVAEAARAEAARTTMQNMNRAQTAVVSQIKNVKQLLDQIDDSTVAELFPSFTNVTSTPTGVYLKCLKDINVDSLMEADTFGQIINAVKSEIGFKLVTQTVEKLVSQKVERSRILVPAECKNTKFTHIWSLIATYMRLLADEDCKYESLCEIKAGLLAELKKMTPPRVQDSVPEIIKRLINNRMALIMMNKAETDQININRCEETFEKLLGNIKLSESDYNFIMAVAHKCVKKHQVENTDHFASANKMLARIKAQRQSFLFATREIRKINPMIAELKEQISAFETPLCDAAHSKLLECIKAILTSYHGKYTSVMENFDSTGVFPEIISSLATKYKFWMQYRRTLSTGQYTFGSDITDVRTFKPRAKSEADSSNGYSICTAESPCPESQRTEMKCRIVNFLMGLHEEHMRKNTTAIYEMFADQLKTQKPSFSENIATRMESIQILEEKETVDSYAVADHRLNLELYRALENICSEVDLTVNIENHAKLVELENKLAEHRGSISFADISTQFKAKHPLEQQMTNHAVTTAQALEIDGKSVNFFQECGVLTNAAENDSKYAISFEQSKVYGELCKQYAQRGNDIGVAFSKFCNNKVMACTNNHKCRFIAEISKVLEESGVDDFYELPLLKRMSLQNMCMFYHPGIDTSININPKFAHNHRLISILKSDDADQLREFIPIIWEILCDKMVENADLVSEIYHQIELGNTVEKGSGQRKEFPNIHIGSSEQAMIKLLLEQKALQICDAPVLTYSNQNFKTLLQMYYGAYWYETFDCEEVDVTNFDVEYNSTDMTKFMLAFAYLTKACKCSNQIQSNIHHEYVNEMVMNDMLKANPSLARYSNLLGLFTCGSTTKSCSGMDYQCIHGPHNENIRIDIPSSVDVKEEESVNEEDRAKFETLDRIRRLNKDKFYSLSKELYEILVKLGSNLGSDIPVAISDIKKTLSTQNMRIGNIRKRIELLNSFLCHVFFESDKTAETTGESSSSSSQKKTDEPQYLQINGKRVSWKEFNEKKAQFMEELTNLQMRLEQELSRRDTIEVGMSTKMSDENNELMVEALRIVSERNTINKSLESSYSDWLKLYKKVNGIYPNQISLSEILNIKDNLSVENMCHLTRRHKSYHENLQRAMEEAWCKEQAENPSASNVPIVNWQEISLDRKALIQQEAMKRQREQLATELAERSATARREREEQKRIQDAQRKQREALAERAKAAVASGQFSDEAAFYAELALREKQAREEERAAKIAKRKAAELALEESQLAHKKAMEAARIKAEMERRMENELFAQKEKERVEKARALQAELAANPEPKRMSKKYERRLALLESRGKSVPTETKSDDTPSRSQLIITAKYTLIAAFNKHVQSVHAFMKTVRDGGFKQVTLPTYITLPELNFQSSYEFRKLQVKNASLQKELDTDYGVEHKGRKYTELYASDSITGQITSINQKLLELGSEQTISAPFTVKDLESFLHEMQFGTSFTYNADTNSFFLDIQAQLVSVIDLITRELSIFAKQVCQIKKTMTENTENIYKFKTRERNEQHTTLLAQFASQIAEHYIAKPDSVNEQMIDLIACMKSVHAMEVTYILEHFQKKSYNPEDTLAVLRKMFCETDLDMSLDTFYRKWIFTTTGREVTETVIDTVKSAASVTTEARYTVIQRTRKGMSMIFLDFDFDTKEEAKTFKKFYDLKKKFGCRVGICKNFSLAVDTPTWKPKWNDFIQNCLVEEGLMTEAEKNTSVFFSDC